MTGTGSDIRVAGRLFRDAARAHLDALNAAGPPGGFPHPAWSVYRHECPVRGSAGIPLRAVTLASPAYRVCYCGVAGPVTAPEGDFPHEDCGASRELAPAGLLSFTWREGRCGPCGLSVRSRDGLLPPPADLAARERQASAHPGDPGQPRA